MPAPELLRYRAFLSYAHADMSWAKWLHRQLEGFKIDKDLAGRATSAGTVPPTLRPIFRDSDDFSGGSSLTDATIAALDASASLIVLCSAVSATRPAVNEEVRLFRFRHPERPVVPVIIDGTYPDNFPPALRFEIASDGSITGIPLTILGPDMRDQGDGRGLGLAKLVAGITGVGTDEIVHRAERERRRHLRNWIVGLSATAAALAGLAVSAEIERRQAVSQRQIAERNFQIAEGAASSLVYDLASGLRDVEGVRVASIRKILGRAEAAYNKLIEQSTGDVKLLHQQSDMYDEFALTFAAQGDTQSQLDAATKSLAIMQSLVKHDPSNRTWLRGLAARQARVADAKRARGDQSGALDLYRSGLQILEKMRVDNSDKADLQSSISSFYTDIGDVLFAQGDLTAALGSYRAALDTPNRQHKATAYGKIGEVLTEQGELKQALASFEATLSIQESLIASSPEDTAYPRGAAVDHIHIGDTQERLSSESAALEHFSAARDLLQGLVKLDPGNALRVRDLSIALERVGSADDQLDDLPAALASYQERHKLAEQLVALDSHKVEWQLDLAVSHQHLGTVLIELDRLDEALEHQQQAVALLQNLVKANPGNTRILLHLPAAERNLGDIQSKQGDVDAALATYKAALAENENLLKAEPLNTRWLQDEAWGYDKIAEALLASGQWQEALGSYRSKLAIADRLAVKDIDNLEWQFDLAAAYWHIAAVERDHDQADDAAKEFRTAHAIMVRLTQLRPDNKTWIDDLAWVDRQISALAPCHSADGAELQISSAASQLPCADPQ